MVLFEYDADGKPQYVSADDDSGEGFNSHLKVRLVKGRRYVLRIRLYWSGATGRTAVMMW